MTKIVVVFGLFFASLAFATTPENSPEHLNSPYVLLVSIDGFRHDYMEKFQSQNLLKFAETAVRVQGLVPSYPSKTFPNHYSIVTGLPPGKHGLVSNSFYDPDRKEVYSLRDRKTVKDGTWYSGTPLWNLAGERGMLSASYFWVGSDTLIGGKQPTYFFDYDGNVSHEKRIDQVIRWLQLPEKKRPHFITLYFSTVDTDAHRYGVESPQLKARVAEIDRDFGLLLSRLKEVPVKPNIVLVSDHGMIDLDMNKQVYLSDLISLDGWKVVYNGTNAYMYALNPKLIESTFDQLRKKAKNFRVFRRNDAPKQWQLSDNKRFGDIIIEMKPPFSIFADKKSARHSPGAHGYDPENCPEMKGVFLAFGPDIKAPKKLGLISNLEVFPFLRELLHLTRPGDVALPVKSALTNVLKSN